MEKSLRKKQDDQNTLIRSIKDKLGIPNIIARILLSRGITTPEEAEAFLFPRLKDLSDPFQLPDIEKGIHVLIETIKKRGRICIYGDYDSDGVTSSALMYNFLKKLNLSPSVYIPDRKEGYGLNMEAIKRLKADKTDLIICLDCGSSNLEEVKFAEELGIKVIIIDHHEVLGHLPPARAVVNPKRGDSRFKTRELAACGVTFFFLWGLRRIIHDKGLMGEQINLKNELDLVTLGTIGDMVPLVGDNRVLTKIGLETMREKPRQWLKTFYKENMLPGSKLNEFALNFIIIPRINAAGRVSDPEEAFNFLISERESESTRLLNTLHNANSLRQQLGERIMKECREEIERCGLHRRNSIVLCKKDWHIGVIGIVAQKLAEIYGKPSLVMTEVDGIFKGSGRGTEDINLYNTISSLSNLLIRFGGHRFACGFSLRKENLELFRDAFDDALDGRSGLKNKEVAFDTSADFEELTMDFVNILDIMSPFGIGNPRPSILLKPTSITMAGGSRIKVTDRNSISWYGYIQNGLKIPEKKSDCISIIANPVIKEEMGNKFINLNIKAILGD